MVGSLVGNSVAGKVGRKSLQEIFSASEVT